MQFFHNMQIRLLDKSTLPIFLSSVLVFFTHLFILLLRVQPREQPIPLHYNIYFGIDFIGEWWYLYTLPALGLIFLLLNTIIGLLLGRSPIVRTLVFSCALIAQALLLIAVVLLLENILK